MRMLPAPCRAAIRKISARFSRMWSEICMRHDFTAGPTGPKAGRGLAIALMAGEIASPALSRMTVPVVYYIVNKRRRQA